ncbi:MAG: Ig-like domain-containing protein, partial [Planctomycetota bacterium]|nr:Ig-like domain-containing protein [Planctomycetota bacterium]
MVLKSTTIFQSSGEVRSFLYAESSGQTNSAITDLFGNLITANSTRANRDCFRFEISASNVTAPDNTAPTITRVTPSNSTTNVSRSSPITIQFSEAMDPSSARLSNSPVTVTVTNSGNGQAIAGELSFADDLRSVTFTPSQVIPTNTVVQVAILNGAGNGNELTDLAGNQLSPMSFSFTTGSNQFAISGISPNAGELIGGETVIVQGDGFSSAATVTIDGLPCKNVQFLNQSQLSVIVPAGQSFGAKDVVVTNTTSVTATLSGGYSYRNQGVGKQAPEIFFEFPPANSNGNSSIASNSKMILVFSEPMDASATSISYNNTLVPQSGFNNTTGTLAFALNNRIVVLDPDGDFNNSNASLDVYRFRNSTGGAIKDTGGQLLNNILLADIRFFIGAPDEGVTYRWTVGPADVVPPTLTSQSPAGGSTHSVRPPIRLTFSEIIDPVTVANSFQVTDSTGVVPGTFEFDLETLTSFVFTPARDLTGASATVNATAVEDLAGNTNQINTFTFNLGNDTIAPTINLLTINDIPAHLNGTDSRAPGTLFLTDTGFTIDIDFQDDGGSGLPINTSAISMTANVLVGTAVAGTNLAPLFPAPNIFMTDSEAHFLVPDHLNFQTGVTITLTVTIGDNAGNTSAASTFQFVCGEKSPQSLPFETVETWFLTFDRDFDSFNYDFANFLLNDVTNDSVSSNGISDFDEELLGLGLRSNAGMTALVNGSTTLTVNQAARNWVINRTLFYMAKSYGHAVDFSESGSANPGFSEIREYSAADTGPGGARVRFVFATGDPGASFS